ncbi:hypothetical protein K492DRAFT_200373 [Lichtheimia hyalospora FSU 10163]|nr:hypothetical protein K492DRAFT_200373 [Lichtheimia hyalospora FSU 10163]
MSRSNQPQTPGGSNRPHSDSAKPRKYTRYSDGTRRASTSSNVSIRSAAASGTSIVETPPSASQSSAQELSHATSTNEPNNARLASLQDALDTLYDEWMSVEIVFQSIQTAFPVAPLAPLSYEERLDDVDRELSIAYDDLMVQVRRIHRNLNRLSSDMAHFRATKLHNQHASSSSSSEQQPQDRAHDDNSNGRTTASQ